MTAKPFEFEKALAELEEITTWFESSDVDLDAGLAKFERGMELAAELKTHLASVENRVEKIRQKFSAEAQRPESQPATPPPGPTRVADADTDQTGLFGA